MRAVRRGMARSSASASALSAPASYGAGDRRQQRVRAVPFVEGVEGEQLLAQVGAPLPGAGDAENRGRPRPASSGTRGRSATQAMPRQTRIRARWSRIYDRRADVGDRHGTQGLSRGCRRRRRAPRARPARGPAGRRRAAWGGVRRPAPRAAPLWWQRAPAAACPSPARGNRWQSRASRPAAPRGPYRRRGCGRAGSSPCPI